MSAKTILFGNGTIAVECLKHMTMHSDVVAVVPEPSDTGKEDWQKSLKKASEELGLNTITIPDIRSNTFLDKIKKLSPDFIFSVQCRRILDKKLLSIPKKGAINLHFSLLPKYRGCYPIAWSIINGESQTGVTLHYIDEDIDTGDIIAQKLVPIGHTETAREVFDKCINAALELFKKELKNILHGNIKRTPQDNNKALYYSKDSLDFKKNRINWKEDVTSLYNWIRAFIFPPYQCPYFSFNDEKIYVTSVSGVSDLHSSPGELIDINDTGVAISARNGSIIIKEVMHHDMLLSAREFAIKNNMAKGTIVS